MAQAVAYSAAQLVAYAPQKARDFPKFDRVFPGRRPKAPQSAEEGLRVMAQFALIINRPKGSPQ